MKTKPPYKIPSMAEIKRYPKNGFKVISTFSGCGGSSLGYKLAGYEVIYANEFIPAAQETYAANFPDTFLDKRDIRTVTPDEVLEITGLKRGELDLFDGSPPCASFSTAGLREEGWGRVKKYSDTEQRTDDLFFEYARLLEGVQPKVFVAENVKGLTFGTAKEMLGDFQMDMLKDQDDTILHTLIDCGYRVGFRVLNAADLGVPQTRNRVIFVGIRLDLAKKHDLQPRWPAPLGYQYTVRDAIPWLSDCSTREHGFSKSSDLSLNKPAPTVMSQSGKGSWDGHAVTGRRSPPPRRDGKSKGKSDPPSRVTYRVVHDTSGKFSQGDVTDKPCPAITIGVDSLNSRHYQVVRIVEKECDLTKYATGDEWDNVEIGKGSKKYFNLVRPDPDKPCPCVTQTAGTPGAAGVSHPYEKRKFSIEELKLISSFPDDFILTGKYKQRWERIGRAVPPLMMKAVAECVRKHILSKIPR